MNSHYYQVWSLCNLREKKENYEYKIEISEYLLKEQKKSHQITSVKKLKNATNITHVF